MPGAVVFFGWELQRGWEGVARHGGCGRGWVEDDVVDAKGSVACVRGREVPVGCLVDAHRGCVQIARVDAGGMGAGHVAVVGRCADESCREVGEAQLVTPSNLKTHSSQIHTIYLNPSKIYPKESLFYFSWCIAHHFSFHCCFHHRNCSKSSSGI